MIKLNNIPKKEMNKTEEKYAWILEAQKRIKLIKYYGFEKIKLKIGNNCWYTPDFIVIDNKDRMKLIEVKGGFIRDDAIVKFKSVCSLYPFIVFEMWQYKNKKWEIIRSNYDI